MSEVWKPVQGYEHLYSVSNMGNVRRERKTNSGEAGSYLATVTDSGGYKRVSLFANGKATRFYVHRLVASAFVDGCGRDVNHIDGNKKNNKSINLEWVSHKENMDKAVDLGLIKSHPVRQSRDGKEIAVYPSLCEMSRVTGFNKQNVSKCCNGKRQRAYGYEWSWTDSGGDNNVGTQEANTETAGA